MMSKIQKTQYDKKNIRMVKKKLSKKITAQVRKYITILKKDKLPIQRVLVYGSYAKGTPHKWSDIDVCIVSPKFKDTWSAIEYLWAQRPFDKNYTIEPVGFSVKDFNDSSSLVDEIKSTGIDIDPFV